MDHADKADEAFGAELTALYPSLMGVAMRLVRSRPAAQDVVQETMFRAWRARRQFTPGTSLGSWTSTILRNVYFTEARRAKTTAACGVGLVLPRDAAADQEAIMIAQDLAHGVERLAATQRQALVLALDGSSYDEMGSTLGCPAGTVKSRVCRARAQLRGVLEGQPIAA